MKKLKTILIFIIIICTAQICSASEYDFSDEAQERFSNFTIEPVKTTPKTLTGSIIQIQAGTPVEVTLASTITSANLSDNFPITAILAEDWIVNGVLIAPAGSSVTGKSIDTKSASFALGNGQIGLIFNNITLPNGRFIPLSTHKVFVVADSNRAKRVFKNLGKGLLSGTILGLIMWGLGSKPSTALITGAVAAAGVGGYSVISQKGEEIELVEGVTLEIELAEPMTTEIYEY